MIITEQHLRIVVSLMHAMEKHYQVHFLLNWKQQTGNCWLFGLDENNPAAPCIKMKLGKSNSGDYYSGSIEYDDDFSVANLYDAKKNKLALYYNRTATNLAGDCSTLTCSYAVEPDMPRLEDLFFTSLTDGKPLPGPFLPLIGKEI